MRDTLLLIGNGFVIDYKNHFPKLPDPNCPLDLALPTPGVADVPLRSTFAELWEQIELLRAAEPSINDFMLMERLLLLPKPPQPSPGMAPEEFRSAMRLSHHRALIEAQLRLHLTHAYTEITRLISDPALRSWRWYEWFLRNKIRLHTAVSFNYDLLLEKTLHMTGQFKYIVSRIFVPNLDAVVVFKPHGSINFEFPDISVHITGDKYSKKNVFELINSPIRILHEDEMHCQRINSDIVLPTEASKIRYFQYIAPGFSLLKTSRNEISRCVIVGLSYWDCDRPEIDEMLNYLSRDTRIIVCNPHPPKDLEKRIRSRFRHVQVAARDLPD